METLLALKVRRIPSPLLFLNRAVQKPNTWSYPSSSPFLSFTCTLHARTMRIFQTCSHKPDNHILWARASSLNCRKATQSWIQACGPQVCSLLLPFPCHDPCQAATSRRARRQQSYSSGSIMHDRRWPLYRNRCAPLLRCLSAGPAGLEYLQAQQVLAHRACSCHLKGGFEGKTSRE